MPRRHGAPTPRARFQQDAEAGNKPFLTVFSQFRDITALKNERVAELSRVLREPAAFGLTLADEHQATVKVAREHAARNKVLEDDLAAQKALVRQLQAEVVAMYKMQAEAQAGFDQVLESVKQKAVEQAHTFAELEQQHEDVRRRDLQHSAVLAAAEARNAELRARIRVQKQKHWEAMDALRLQHQQDMLAHRRDLAVVSRRNHDAK